MAHAGSNESFTVINLEKVTRIGLKCKLTLNKCRIGFQFIKIGVVKRGVVLVIRARPEIVKECRHSSRFESGSTSFESLGFSVNPVDRGM